VAWQLVLRAAAQFGGDLKPHRLPTNPVWVAFDNRLRGVCQSSQAVGNLKPRLLFLAKLEDRQPIPVFKDFAPRFQQAIEVQFSEKPRTVDVYKARLGTLLADPELASTRLVGLMKP
jgi:hypothetical protein